MRRPAFARRTVCTPTKRRSCANGDLASQSALHDVITNGQTYTIISTGICATQLLSDGFEPPAVSPVAADGSYTQSAPASVGAWNVSSGTVSVVSTSKWNLHVGGVQAVELSGKDTYGAIRRTVGGLVPGNTYTLRFNFAWTPAHPRLECGCRSPTWTPR